MSADWVWIGASARGREELGNIIEETVTASHEVEMIRRPLATKA